LEQQLKAHLVFDENSTKILKEISRHCIISGRDLSLEQAGNWAKDGGGEDPDLFLINCRVFFKGRNAEGPIARKNFIHILSQIRQYRKRSRIILLLPQNKGNDAEMIAGLLKMNVYDFWYIDRFDEADIKRFILVKRSLADVEEYLYEIEAREDYCKSMTGQQEKNVTLSGKIKNIYQPYFIKSNIIAFYSHDDSLVNQGAALLTAVTLAELGFKVALVETITSTPHLAGNLSFSHPFCNTRHAISMYVQQDNDFIRTCLFNNEKYREDGYWRDKDRHLASYPASLFFLPDGMREDNIPLAQMKEYWPAFVTELTKVIMFEKDFNFLIFCGCGENTFTEFVMQEIAYLRFITISMLPGSIAYGIKERKTGHGKTRLIGTKKVKYLLDELKELGEDAFLYPPVNFTDEILGYIYLKNLKKISQESWHFINHLTAVIGIRKNDEENRKEISYQISNEIAKLISYLKRKLIGR
jgi:hypothetical protein